METEIIVVFFIIDDYPKSINFKDDNQMRMPTAEIMTVAIVAAYYFGGNQKKARIFFMNMVIQNICSVKANLIVVCMLYIDAHVWECLQKILAEVFKRENTYKNT